jgi:hypothetical protein
MGNTAFADDLLDEVEKIFATEEEPEEDEDFDEDEDEDDDEEGGPEVPNG